MAKKRVVVDAQLKSMAPVVINAPTAAGLFTAMQKQAHADRGWSASVGVDETSLVGLPLPSLAMEYLLQSTVFPLGRLTQITGPAGSAKSLLLYEIYRWHLYYGGGGVHLENENKDTRDLRDSVFNYRPNYMDNMLTQPTRYLQEWQQALTYYVQYLRQVSDMPGGPGRTRPIAIGIDSLMGTVTLEEYAQIAEAGHASRGFPEAAMLITRFMRAFPALIEDYPFSIIGTNHLKPSLSSIGIPSSSSPGGKSLQFMETFEIEMHGTARRDISLSEYNGLQVELVTKKNGTGTSRKRIVAEILWWNDDTDGTYRQRTIWDWDGAAIGLLLSFKTVEGKAGVFRSLQEVCDLQKASDNRVSSTALGIPADKPIPFRAAGAMLRLRPDLIDPIRRILGIKVRKQFQPSMDFRAAREQAITASNTAAMAMSPTYTLPSTVSSEIAEFDPDVEVEEELDDGGDESGSV